MNNKDLKEKHSWYLCTQCAYYDVCVECKTLCYLINLQDQQMDTTVMHAGSILIHPCSGSRCFTLRSVKTAYFALDAIMLDTTNTIIHTLIKSL